MCIPYAVTGWLNLHPRAAIARMREPSYECLEFFDELMAEHALARHHQALREP